MSPARSRSSLVARPLLGLLLGGAFVVLAATPASAHGVSGAQPSNYASTVTSVTPRIAGLSVTIRDVGARIEVRNDSDREVLIFGYSGEPYLRVGPAGAFENVRSPAVFLNRSRTVTSTVPPGYDAAAAPKWRHVGSGQVVGWHDHRVHWMGASLPPAVADSRGRAHLISRWTVAMQYAGQPVEVHGDLRWVPGPSAVPRLLLALAVAVIVLLFGITRWWGAVDALVLAVLAVLVGALVVGEWTATSAGAWSAFLATVYSILGAAVALAASAALLRARRAPDTATPIVLVASVILALGSGLADITALDHSQLPTDLSASLDRTFVAIVLGASVGVLVTAARRLGGAARVAPAVGVPVASD